MTIVLSADDVRAATPSPAIIEVIASIITTDDAGSPACHVHDLKLPGNETGALLLVPSWLPGDVGVAEPMSLNAQ